MKFAIADPPYLGCGQKHYKNHHESAADCDSLEWHRLLIERLVDEYPDGWLLFLSSPSLRHLLPLCPEDVRVAAWVKPFASFKPGVNPAFAWEPVIWRGGRKGSRERDTVRDWVSANITLKKGLCGVKPYEVCEWALDLLGVEHGDNVDDLFPGSGAVQRAVDARLKVPLVVGGLFGSEVI